MIVGVGADGTKELVALADGFGDSSESSADLLRSWKRRGMRPGAGGGGGALGFWKGIREVHRHSPRHEVDALALQRGDFTEPGLVVIGTSA